MAKTVNKVPVAKEEKSAGIGDGVQSTDNEFQAAVTNHEKADTKERYPGEWIKMSEDECAAHQKAGNLVGWHPKSGEGLLIDNPKPIDHLLPKKA